MKPTPPPARKPPLWIVVAGNPATGFRFLGPFEDEDAAEDARTDLELDGGEAAFTARLEPPDLP